MLRYSEIVRKLRKVQDAMSDATILLEENKFLYDFAISTSRKVHKLITLIEKQEADEDPDRE